METKRIVSCLENSHGLRVREITPLFLGADFHAGTYRVRTEKGEDFFLKICKQAFDPVSLLIPESLAQLGMEEIISPIPTEQGELWCKSDFGVFILYPFVSGCSGWEGDLSEKQWKEFGQALRFLHEVPRHTFEDILISHEDYAPFAREKVRSFLFSSPENFPKESAAAELHSLMKEREKLLCHILERAESFGQSLASRNPKICLCHGDIHAGNILVEPSGKIRFIDWDTLAYAPKERDLMFIGGGIGGKWNKKEEVEWFYKGYSKGEIDLEALVYYRYERIVQDTAEFCDFLTQNPEKNEESMKALSLFTSQFEENNVVPIALETDRKFLSCAYVQFGFMKN